MAGNFHFRNVNTYVYQPEGESIITQPSQASMDFTPRECIVEEAPNDNVLYGRQNESWEEVTKENITGITILDTPEFADELITPLTTEATNGGSVPAADYNWFKGVYASLVDGSVLSWIKGLVNQVKSLATRVGLLEDKYILKYVVPVDTTAINLTTDKYGNPFNFQVGDRIVIIMNGKSNSNDLYSTVVLQLNGITSAQFFYNGTNIYPGILGYVCALFTNKWQIFISSDSIQATLSANRTVAAMNSFLMNVLSFFSKPVSAGGLVIPPITSLTFISTYTIYAGTEIIIVKEN